MSNVYYPQATTVATAATDQHAIVEIWNPSTTRAIMLMEIAVVVFAAPGAGAGFVLRRSTAKGTPGSTVTPAAYAEREGLAAPGSSFTIEVSAFTVQPTLTTGKLHPAWVFPAVTASGIILPIPRGIEVPPGQGLVLCNRAAIAFPTAEVGFVIED